MLNTKNLAALAILGILAINPAFAEDKSVAMVNGVSIPQARIDLNLKAAAMQGQADSPELRKSIRENMINVEVVSQEATKMGLDKDPDVIQQTELARQSILTNAFAKNYLKDHPISEDQLHQAYDKLKASLGNQEYDVRHILVDTEAEAKAIIAQLNKEAKSGKLAKKKIDGQEDNPEGKQPIKNDLFDKLAKKNSKDTGSATRGGTLGWNSPSNFVQPFADALVKLKEGEYTKEPVQSQFGWHIIKLDDVRSLKMPSFEEIKPQLQQRLQQQAVASEIINLRAKAKIE